MIVSLLKGLLSERERMGDAKFKELLPKEVALEAPAPPAVESTAGPSAKRASEYNLGTLPSGATLSQKSFKILREDNQFVLMQRKNFASREPKPLKPMYTTADKILEEDAVFIYLGKDQLYKVESEVVKTAFKLKFNTFAKNGF